MESTDPAPDDARPDDARADDPALTPPQPKPVATVLVGGFLAMVAGTATLLIVGFNLLVSEVTGAPDDLSDGKRLNVVALAVIVLVVGVCAVTTALYRLGTRSDRRAGMPDASDE